MAISDTVVGGLGPRKGGAEELRQRNEELEKEVKEGKEREYGLQFELERTLGRLRMVDEAEERLCVQLGELEAEGLVQALAYQQRIRELVQQLAFVESVIRSRTSLPVEC